MSARALLAALLLGAPAAAQVPITGEVRYAPDPAWYRGGGLYIPQDGRVRIVTAPQGYAALTLEQYWRFEQDYRRAMGRLALSMPVAQADPLARGQAMEATLARYPTLRVSAIPVAEIAAPDVWVRPLR